jgi:RNA polymerase sigma-70 factor (ECF subfamily)
MLVAAPDALPEPPATAVGAGLASPDRADGAETRADVALAAGGDRRAFERLYRGQLSRVFGLCARMTGDRVLAEELTQDVFVRAWERLASFRGESAFGTWLHRLAVNVVLNARKSAGRDRSRLRGLDDEPGSHDRGDGGVAQRHASGGGSGDRTAARTTPWIAIDLEAAIAGLPPGARRVFVLHDVEGYRHEEIGTMLGITAGGSKAQLHRARFLLRGALNR